MLLSVTNLVKLYPVPIIGCIARRLNLLLGVDISRKVQIGKKVKFPHNSIGTVLHDKTVIEDNVKIYQNVTFGRADVYRTTTKADSDFGGFHIKNGACICAGAKLICKKGVLTIGEDSVIGANSVVLNSVGAREIWAGSPAKFIGYRDDV